MKSAKNLIPMFAIGFFAGCAVMGVIGAFMGQPKSLNSEAVTQAVLQTLDTQVEAWNAGDIEAFMQDYLKTDDLRFASGGTIETGWDATLARYQSRYPDRATMGQLEFSNREVKALSAEDALVFGRWTLIRDTDRPTGLFTLHMKKQDTRWIIVSDHTSSAQ